MRRKLLKFVSVSSLSFPAAKCFKQTAFKFVFIFSLSSLTSTFESSGLTASVITKKNYALAEPLVTESHNLSEKTTTYTFNNIAYLLTFLSYVKEIITI